VTFRPEFPEINDFSVRAAVRAAHEGGPCGSEDERESDSRERRAVDHEHDEREHRIGSTSRKKTTTRRSRDTKGLEDLGVFEESELEVEKLLMMIAFSVMN
jgi:hypothetical protein